jgi:hypothetical protein
MAPQLPHSQFQPASDDNNTGPGPLIRSGESGGEINPQAASNTNEIRAKQVVSLAIDRRSSVGSTVNGGILFNFGASYGGLS